MIDTEKFNNVVATAKDKAAGNARWIRAIERAEKAILAGELIITTLADNRALVTSANGSYWVNGSCQCAAAKAGHRECYHRAAARIWAMYEEAILRPATQPVHRSAKRQPTKPVITRSIERDHSGNRYTVTRCDGWMI
jgi:hypothetical protein